MFWIPVAVWMGVIFYFSAQDGDTSGGISGKILQSILDFFNIYNANIELLGLLLRKAAHASVYFVLAALIILALIKSSKATGKKIYFITLAISFLYACSDELHQLFIQDRAARFTDVIIDVCGACAALLMFYVGSRIYAGIKQKKLKKEKEAAK